MIRRTLSITLVALAVLALLGCGSSAPQLTTTADERFARAKALFDDEDYLDAINEFAIITVQDQGSAFASEAQYYIAEARFAREEWQLAQFDYNLLRRSYPASPRAPEALYKSGVCYYNLSPRSPLDQQFTRKAIDELQAFVEYYPAHEFAPDADKKIRELNNRLARKAYETARLYATMEYYKAAILSYDNVIEKFHDSDVAPLAFIEKVELLVSRSRYPEAQRDITTFLERYPNSVLRARAESLKQEIDQEIKQIEKSPPAPDSKHQKPLSQSPGGM